jgi:hypothetical protein
LLRRAQAGLLVALSALSLAVAAADPGAKKPERRLPPTGSQTAAIPGGSRYGSPATSNSMQLGTPVPPSTAADRADQNKRSAAARAAARPAPGASAASAPLGPVATDGSKSTNGVKSKAPPPPTR